MGRLFLYLALTIAVCIYAWWKGGGPERAIASTWLVSNLLSAAAFSLDTASTKYRGVEWSVFAIDGVTLVVLIWFMLRAYRRWPMVVVGMHFVATVAHIVKLISPDMIRIVYAILIAYLSYPLLLAIALGVYFHQRRLKRFGSDPDWRSQTIIRG